MKQYDVIIVGAGPGGLTAATILGAAQRSVLLVEKNAIIGPKICAGGFTIKDLHIGVPIELSGRTFDTMALYSPSGRKTTIHMEYPFLRTIPRPVLGAWMEEKLRQHGSVEIRTGAAVTDIRDRTIVLNHNEEVGFGSLIGADGSLSVVRRHLGLPIRQALAAIQYNVTKQYDEIGFYLDTALFGPGYAWIFPHGDFTSIGCGRLTSYPFKHSLLDAFRVWLDHHQIDVSGAKLEGWTINCDYRGHTFGNIHLVGDAAGFTSGLTGEGIYFAMVSGTEIAKHILDPHYDMPAMRHLLAVKHRHERLLWFLSHGRFVPRMLHELAVFATRSHRIAEKAVELFG